MRETYAVRFGDKVRALREAKGLSQERLAEKAGLHRTHISMIERAERSVRIETVEKLAIGLGVHPAELMPSATRRR